jgi:putative peptide zinc metalloprotease protein
MSVPFLSSTWHRVAELRPRLKPHGEIDAHLYGGETWYILRDHATNRVHRFTASAFAVIGALDGERTLEAIWSDLAHRLGDAAPSQDDVVRLLAHLHQQDLLAAGIPPESHELLERMRKQASQQRAKLWKNPLSITLPLFNPDRLLEAMLGALGWIRQGWLLALWAAFVLPCAVLAGLHAEELTANLADQVLAAHNLAILALVFPVAKIIHELGHGLAAKANGGAVDECGLMLLALYPVPYVDASSAQAFPSKWDRALVGAAGMMTELALAGVALIVWVNAEDGLLKAACFNIMLIAGVSTLVVNANPLLRFDGYFILCDLLELPNLAQRAGRWWGRKAERLLVGRAAGRPDPVTPFEAVVFGLYAPAAYVARLIVLASLALFVATEYLFVGVLIALWALFLGVVQPLGKMVRHLVSHPGFGEKRGRAIAIAGGLGASFVAVVALLPLPHHAMAEGVMWLPEDAQLRAGIDGFIADIAARPGERVRKGDVLVTLRDPLLETRFDVQKRKVAEVEARLAVERFGDQSRAALARQELEDARAEEARLTERLARTTLRAASDGVFSLPRAGDWPGRFVREGQVVAHVLPEASAGEKRLRALVSQDDIELVRRRTRSVEALLPDRMDAPLRAAVIREVPAADNRLPSPVLGSNGGGRFALDPRDPDGQKLLARVFQFDLALADSPADIGYGSRVHLRFALEPEALGPRLMRRVRQLFLSQFNA